MKVEWDFTHLYAGDKDWNEDFENLKNKIDNLNRLLDDCLNTSDSLFHFISLKLECDELVEKLYCYAKRHLDVNSTLQDYKKKLEDALSLYSEIQKVNAIFENKIIQNNKVVLEYLNENQFKEYVRYFSSILRRNQHISLNEEAQANHDLIESKLKQEYQDMFQSDVSFENVNIDGENKILNRNTYNDLIINPRQSNRKLVFDTYTKAYQNCNQKLTDIYLKKLKNDITLAQKEKYPTLLSKKLFELELPDDIVDVLIKKINDHLNIMHDYVDFKKKISGLEEYHIYDTNVSLCDIPKIEYSLKETLSIIKNSLSLLGEDYIKVIDQMFQEGWVDVYPKENKRTMSFTCISYVGVPYILINYNASVSSARTLAHEIGHALHVYYSKTNNAFQNFEFSYFLTEIASKVNEILVNEYMIQCCDNEQEKIYIMNNIINGIGNSLFGQVMLTEFEHTVIHKLGKEGNLTADNLNELYMELSKKYNGMTFSYDDNLKYGWSKIPHFIMQDSYYLYQYSIGMAIADNIAYRILDKEEGIVEKYKKFLSAGNSVSISEALSYLDINLENGTYIDQAIETLDNKIKTLKKIVK